MIDKRAAAERIAAPAPGAALKLFKRDRNCKCFSGHLAETVHIFCPVVVFFRPGYNLCLIPIKEQLTYHGCHYKKVTYNGITVGIAFN